MKKYNGMNVFCRIFRQTMRAVPGSGVIGILNYVVKGAFPAITALIVANLFQNISLLIDGESTLKTVIGYAVLWILSFAVVYILELIASITINAGIYERCSGYFRELIAEKSARLRLIDYENADILNMRTKAMDCVNREIPSQIFMTVTLFLTGGFSIISTIAVLSAYNILFLPISLLSVIPFLVARIIRGKDFYQVRNGQAPLLRKQQYLWSLFISTKAMKEMRVMGSGEYLQRSWETTRDEVNAQLRDQTIKDGRSLLFCDLLKILGYCGSLLLALYLTAAGQIQFGAFSACIAAFAAVQDATKAFLIEIGGLSGKNAFAKDLFMFLDIQEDTGIIGNEGETPRSTSAPVSIQLDHISFSYPKQSKKAIDDVSIRILPGKATVIVGENGSGKTTLAKLILGMYLPSLGMVSVNGRMMNETTKSYLYMQSTVVQQEYARYCLSLREAVALSDLSLAQDDSRIRNALVENGLSELNGVDLSTQLGRDFDGIGLSGGQWQKIALARGMFRDASLVILDEPTSAFDPLIEMDTLKRFLALAQNKTSIIISHRVGLCKYADQIVVMKNGKVCETGTHAELLHKHGEYYQLYSAQSKWYQDRVE